MELLPSALWVHWRQAADSYQWVESGRENRGRECGKKILDSFVGWFRSLLPRPLRSNPLSVLMLINGRRVSGSLYSWRRRRSFSVLFFLFLLFFLSVFNCHLYFLWESRHLLSQLRGTVHGTDKEKMNIFCSPMSQFLCPPLSPPLFNYSPLSFFFIHLSSHLSVHVTLLFLNHSHRRREGCLRPKIWRLPI